MCNGLQCVTVYSTYCAVTKALVKAGGHESTRQRLIEWIAPPTSHLDELRVMPAAQLAQLSDKDLVNQALLVMTVKNP